MKNKNKDESKKKKTLAIPSKKEIESEFSSWTSIGETRLQKVKQRNQIMKTRKEAKFTARLTTEDFEGLKKVAEQMGMPYQTLLGSVIHQYIHGYLVHVEEIRKVFPRIKFKKSA